MAYIGREPQIGNFQVCDDITVVNGQAAYTMQVDSVNVFPETANHCLVSLNGVLQKSSGTSPSFTISGSTITFASNLVTGDVINFIHILGSVLDLGVPSDSTVSLAKLTATGTKSSSTFLRGDNTFASAGESNTPAFQAVRTSSQNFSHETETKAQFDVETFDTAGAYDNSTNYRFTPQTAGKYYVYTRCQIDAQAASNLKNAAASIYKNGSTHLQSEMNEADNQAQNINVSVHGVVDMNGSSDYVEVYVYGSDESGSPRLKGSSFTESLFGAFLLTA